MGVHGDYMSSEGNYISLCSPQTSGSGATAEEGISEDTHDLAILRGADEF